MRTAFIETLCDVAQQDERVWLLCGDLGYSVLERFAERFPERFINMGVAEQNMMGVAAGLARGGKIVFTYSIANFPVMRCLEQIRNDIGYHAANVKIVAVGGGMAYGTAGYTHHGVEDLAVMRVMPNMTVIAPGDPVETRLATRAVAAHNGPCYLRLGKGGEPVVHTTPPEFAIGRALILRAGADVALLSTGAILPMALAASDILADTGVGAAVVSVPTLRPLDRAAIIRAAVPARLVVTVEEHLTWGGLGSAVAEVLSEESVGVRLLRLGLTAAPDTVGAQAYLRRQSGLDATGIAEAVRAALA
ncbi:MAG TPA: transketolase C-terminal domain-containing protein [Ktedonobacterales bacterium]|nr:transketolase C-terminal domain-containing protein [Ktedonobacterales bacterium]